VERVYDPARWPAAGIGYRLAGQEQSRLYRYWWYVGHLLGLDEEFFLGIEDHQQAGELLDLLDSTSGAPDENSRALVGALFDAATTNLAAVSQSPLDIAGWRDLLNAAGRPTRTTSQGPEQAMT
jgi:hypothetical protein